MTERTQTQCRGHRSRISPKRPHVLCLGCARWAYAVPGDVPELVQEGDGAITCPGRVPVKPESSKQEREA